MQKSRIYVANYINKISIITLLKVSNRSDILGRWYAILSSSRVQFSLKVGQSRQACAFGLGHGVFWGSRIMSKCFLPETPQSGQILWKLEDLI
jgi:hypothetical protein